MTGWVPPREFEEYRLQRLLGAGGMGQVYLARDELLDRAVAIKFISDVEPDRETRSRFLIEARAAARVAHPNVVAVHRVGEIDGRPFIVSEYVHGVALSSLELPLSLQEVLRIGVDLARGLAAAHRQGVLHRDLKPGNAVLTDEGPVKILDFGLAKLLSGASEPAAVPVVELEGHAATRRLHAEDRAADPAVPSFSALDKPVVVAVSRRPGVDLEGPSRSPPSSPHVTAAGSVMGTPLYMAPEVWSGAPAARAADIYALGAVLYELASGKPPHAGEEELPLAVIQVLTQEEDAAPLLRVAPATDPRLAEIVDRCLRRDPAQRPPSVDAVRDALEQIAVTPTVVEARGAEPYRGLAAFEAAHRAYFLGRAAETRAIVDRLRGSPFVLVAGDSGVGKSSICSAGVLPLLADDPLVDGRRWTGVSVPIGRHPVVSLAAALANLLGRSEEEATSLIRGEPHAVVRELRSVMPRGTGMIFFLDQLEELVTLATPADAAVVAAFVHEIAVGVPGLKLLATLRGDFLTRLASIPGLASEVQQAFFLLPPMTAEGVRQAIVGPAEALGVIFESSDMVDELVAAASSASGGLPLLQFALAELWRRRDQKTGRITRAALAALGGVEGALAGHADAVVAGLPPGQRRSARRIFTRLVTPEGTRATRDERELTDGDPDTQRALTALVRGRLIVAREAGERGEQGTTYEITHEALLNGWTALRRWLGEKAESRAVVHRLEIAASEWERLGQPDEALWGDAQLDEAVALDAGELRERERDFLRASRRRRASGRWRRGILFVAAPLLIVLTWAGVQLANRHEQAAQAALLAERTAARIGGRVTEARHLLSDATAAMAAVREKRAAASAALERGEPGGEAEWTTSLLLAERADDFLVRASHELELALLYGGDTKVRAVLADALVQRAELAELDGRLGERDELLERLALYDPQGRRRQRFQAPAELILTDLPEGAKVRLGRYQPWEGRLGLVPVAMPDGSATLELPPGSYLVTLHGTTLPTVRWAIRLKPGARESVPLKTPRASAVPAGFVYVPPGVFQRGAREVELRASLHALPLREDRTGGFLIALHETSVADWSAFLQDLPEAERARFPLRPRGADARAPMTGLSPEDALAYVRWLATSRKVPRARLCQEGEWERAARGGDTRAYPTGDLMDGNCASGRVAPVGSFPAAASPFGVEDLSGNAREVVAAGREHVGKGGGFDSTALDCHVAARSPLAARERVEGLGLRVCADLP